jgi:hypothetical protein
VVDEENQLPLGFVQLRLQVVGVRGVLEARSDTSGRFSYCEVPSGTFTIAGHFGRMSGLFGPGELDPGETFFIRMQVGELAVTYETGTLTGSVINAVSEMPVEGATVLLRGRGQAAVTNAFGRFTFPSLPPGPVDVQAVRGGLAEANGQVEVEVGRTVETRVRLSAEPMEMEPVTVTGVQRRIVLPGMESLERRYYSGWGMFVLEEDIQSRNPSKLSDVFDDPGLEVQDTNGGIAMRRTGCAPDVFVDGVKLTHSSKSASAPRRGRVIAPEFMPLRDESISAEEEAEAAVNLVHPLSVLVVEVYRGPAETPGQYLSSEAQCGLILVWTRRGNISGGARGRPHTFSWEPTGGPLSAG